MKEVSRATAETCSTAVAGPQTETCSTAVAGKVWDIPVVIDIVVNFCSPCPGKQFNQIAVADRLFNIAWRRRMHTLQKYMLREVILGLTDRDRGGSSVRTTSSWQAEVGVSILLDLEDVFNTASEETRRLAGRAVLRSSSRLSSQLRFSIFSQVGWRAKG